MTSSERQYFDNNQDLRNVIDFICVILITPKAKKVEQLISINQSRSKARSKRVIPVKYWPLNSDGKVRCDASE